MSDNQTPQQHMAEECEPLRQLTAEHAMLRPFAGTFRASVLMWLGPGEPMRLTGRMENRLDLGGSFLHQRYAGEGSYGPFGRFEGRGYWGYNTVLRRFESLWIDTATTFFQIEYGSVDATGKRWEMTGEMTDPSTGRALSKRTVIELIDADHHTMATHFKKEGEAEVRVMEIAYERAAE